MTALLTASLGVLEPAAAAGDDVTTTTLTISPANQQYAGGLVTFDIGVTAGSGTIPQGFVAIQTTSVCGTGSPLVFGNLASDGTASLSYTFTAPFDYQL